MAAGRKRSQRVSQGSASSTKRALLNQCSPSASGASHGQRWARPCVVRASTPVPITAANQPGANVREISAKLG